MAQESASYRGAKLRMPGFTEDDAITTMRDSAVGRSEDGANGLGDPHAGVQGR